MQEISAEIATKKKNRFFSSVVDPVYPRSRIQTTTKEEWEKFVVLFFCSCKFNEIVNYFIFEQVHKKLEPSDKNFLIKLSNID
jgi:hypothetical protein